MIIAVVIIIVLLLIILKQIRSNRQSKQFNSQGQQISETSPQESPADIAPAVDETQYFRDSYTRKWMFTPNEKAVYFRLKNLAAKHDLLLFAKVRLFDLVTPIRNHPKYQTNLNKIQAKHVDFVFTKSNLVAKYVIELDDSSHDTTVRRDRDHFVDAVLCSCGYKVLHIREVNEAEIEKFLAS